jgi:hypothetical protein
MRIDSFHGLAAWLAGLAITLVLASWLTPREWWRRPTARNLCLAVLGTWAFGSLILHFASAPQPQMQLAGLPGSFAPASAMQTQTAAPIRSLPPASLPFRVHRDLNLRASASVDAERLALVPAGASVTPTGIRNGDWWEVRAHADGKTSTGWVSSLWLRRAAE